MPGSPYAAGVAVEEIVPPAGLRMSGFAGRGGPNIGCRDPLRVSALYVADGHTAAVIICLDCIGLSPRDDGMLRKRIARHTGISPDAVLVACSHTHSAPATMTIHGTGAKEVEWTNSMFTETVRLAGRAMVEGRPVARVRIGAADCPAAINRRQWRLGRIEIGRNAKGLVERRCRILILETNSGPIAALFHYAMHPVVLGAGNRLISADWVGAARAHLEAALGCPALFLQGCCGDINPVLPESDDDRALEVMGSEVSDAALAANAAAEASSMSALRFGSVTARIPLTARPHAGALREMEVQAGARAQDASRPTAIRDAALAEQRWARKQLVSANCDSMSARVSVLALAGVPLVGLPGEIFTEIGWRIRELIWGAWPVGYAAGNVGYLYPDSALEEGGYEVERAYRLYGTRQAGRGTADALVEAVARCV